MSPARIKGYHDFPFSELRFMCKRINNRGQSGSIIHATFCVFGAIGQPGGGFPGQYYLFSLFSNSDPDDWLPVLSGTCNRDSLFKSAVVVNNNSSFAEPTCCMCLFEVAHWYHRFDILRTFRWRRKSQAEHHDDDKKRNFWLLYPVIPGAFSRTRSQVLKEICFFGWPRLHASWPWALYMYLAATTTCHSTLWPCIPFPSSPKVDGAGCARCHRSDVSNSRV